MYDTGAEEAFLRDWASRNKVIYEDEGECGFGRECVGITAGENWIDLGPTTTKHFESASGYSDDYEDQEIDEDAYAPEGVTDAYHKHDCLAILGRGPEAIHQLYLWVKNLADHGFSIGRTPRNPKNQIDLLFHGLEYVHLTKK